jgi:hypothetical protein
VTIGGLAMPMNLYNFWPVRLNQRFGAYCSLTLQKRGWGLPGLPDPWLGKPIVLSIDTGTGPVVYFKGDICDADPTYADIGWITTYQCLDLKRRCDLVPMTDSNTLTDTAAYNLMPEDPVALATRQGRSIGQILTSVLTMQDNANALNAQGVGAYVSLSPPTLPASTIADLATLTIIPPSGVYVQGERLFQAVESFVRFWAPNNLVWIEPNTGAIRFLDKRTFTNHTLTMGTDLIEPTPLRRSVAPCYQAVVVRGQPVAEAQMVDTLNGGLTEDFAWGSLTNSAAKAAWSPATYQLDQQAKSVGTCTCPDTLHVVVDPTDPAQAWIADFWDQTSTGHQGTIFLYSTIATGVQQQTSRRIVANAALTAGGTASIQVDLPLPVTNYDHFSIYGISNGSGLVYRKYKIASTAVGAALARQFTYPANWVGTGGNVAQGTSFPMGSVCFSSTGSPPFSEWPSWFTIDPANANVIFAVPTYITCGNHVPSDVRALLAVNTGHLHAIAPIGGGFAGTSNTVEGLTSTLTVTVGQWRDPINQSAMEAFAADILDSVKDTIVEGSVLFHGLYLLGLTPGIGLSVTGNGYTTGWEGLNLSVTECELTWEQGQPSQHTTVLTCSNRRAHLSAAAFLRPDRPIGGSIIPSEHGWNPFGIFQPSFGQMYQVNQARQAQFAQDYLTPGGYEGFESTMDMTAPEDRAGGTGKKRDLTQAEKMRNAQWNKRQEAQQQKDWDKATRPERAKEQAAERTMGAAAEGMQYFEEHPEELAPAGQEERRARAQSHGSLRQARGFGPEDPTATYSTDVDPQNQIGAGMAEELIQGLNPRRRRRIERERREGGGGE